MAEIDIGTVQYGQSSSGNDRIVLYEILRVANFVHETSIDQFEAITGGIEKGTEGHVLRTKRERHHENAHQCLRQ